MFLCIFCFKPREISLWVPIRKIIKWTRHCIFIFYKNSSLSPEKVMAPHSSTLAWKIPWTEEPGRLQSMGLQRVRHLLRGFTFTFHFHALEKEMATHSSVLAWKIPRMAEPGGLPSIVSHRVRHDWNDLVAIAAALIYFLFFMFLYLITWTWSKH